MGKFFKVLADRTEDFFTGVSAVVIVALMFLTVADVGGRYFFRNPLVGSYEFSTLMLIVIVVVAIGGTQRVHGHIGMDTLLNKFKKLERPVFPCLQALVLFLSIAIFGILLFFAIKALVASIDINEVTTGPLYLPMAPVRGVIVFGVLLMCVRLVYQLTQAIKSIFTWRVE